MKPNFLDRPALDVAPKLLGWNLCRQLPEGIVKLKIVETEAYHQDDPASHSFRGITKRTAPMFKAAGTMYVYFTYGMHYCLNVVCGPAGEGQAVLLRAGEPIEGIEIMRSNRGVNDLKNLANGPGKLTQALGIKDTKLSGTVLNKSSIYLKEPDFEVAKKDIVVGPRIGISKAVEIDARFYLKDNPFVSRI